MIGRTNIWNPKVLVNEVLNLMFKVIAIINPMSPSLHMVSHRAFGSYQVGNGLGRALGGTGVMSPAEIKSRCFQIIRD